MAHDEKHKCGKEDEAADAQPNDEADGIRNAVGAIDAFKRVGD